MYMYMYLVVKGLMNLTHVVITYKSLQTSPGLSIK